MGTPRPRFNEDLPEWADGLKCNLHGKPLNIIWNCYIPLRNAPEFQGAFGWNDFAQTVYKLKPTPWSSEVNVEWTEYDDMSLTEWLQSRDIFVNKHMAKDAIESVAHDLPYNPLHNYLNGLQWDGKNRIHDWLHFYLNCEDTPYVREVGKKWLASAVARAFEPGCKADCALVLEGIQGLKKSTAINKLVGDEFFSDGMHSDLSSKEASILCRGAWVIELSELESLKGSRIESVKKFLANREDRYRPPYGTRAIRGPRRCVFVGSTNKNEHFDDETGARRFWCVMCRKINLKNLERDRDQIWAEAVAYYKKEKNWWLSGEFEIIAQKEQKSRYQSHPWIGLIEEWLPKDRSKKIIITDVLTQCLEIRKSEFTKKNQDEVSACLQHLGLQKGKSGSQRFYKWPSVKPSSSVEDSFHPDEDEEREDYQFEEKEYLNG